jgi:hypothetical protein
MKTLLKIVLGLVVLVVLAAVALYVVVLTFDRDELKRIAAEQAEAATGRELTIAGPLDFRISLTPALVLEDVSFANAPWGSEPDMARIKRFEMELAVMPLFSGDIEIKRIVLVEPQILLETNAEGKGNWELPILEQPATQPSTMRLSKVESISIDDATVTYRDGATGETSVFTLDELTGAAPSATELTVEAAGKADGTPFKMDADLKQSGDTYAIEDADITYGNTKLEGKGSLTTGGARPSIVATFTSPLIDLSPYAAASDGEDTPAEPPAEDTGPYVFTDDPLPLGMLRTADMDIDIEAETLRVSDKIEIKDVALAFTLADGDLILKKLAGTSMEGRVDATGRLNAARSPALLAADLKVTDLDYGEVLKTMDITSDVDGTIDILVDLEGRGNSPRAIASSLGGTTQLVATDGIITNKLLAVVSTGLDKVLGPLLGNQADTKLHCAISHFDINGGQASSRALVVDSDTFTVAGQGSIDLRTEQLDMMFDTRTRQTALASLAVPFRVKGTLKNPKAYPDPLGTAQGAARAAKTFGKLFGGKSGTETQDEGIVDKIGGLFGKLTGQQDTAPQESAAADGDACAAALARIGR